MKALCDKLRVARQNKKLTIEKVSELTKIRPHVISAIESGDFSVMPFVYMKSFVKTYADFLDITYNESDFELSPKTKNKPKEEASDNDSNSSITKETTSVEDKQKEITAKIKETYSKKIKSTNDKGTLKITTDSTNYADIFKNKKIKNGLNPSLVNYIIYASVALFVVLVIYFTVFFNSKGDAADYGKYSNQKDTTNVEKGILDYFKQSDSLSLLAVASDTAWIKIDIDGKESDEIVMRKGMEKKWNANNYFILSQGSVGAVEFYRNGEKLPLFGKQGGVVKNIKITKDKIANTSPWQGDSSRSYTSVNVPVPQTKRYKKKQEENPKNANQMRTIDPAPIKPNNPIKR